MNSVLFPIGKAASGYFVDSLAIEPNGVLRISGWSQTEHGCPETVRLRVNGSTLAQNAIFRVVRPDLGQLGLALAGLIFEFLSPGTAIKTVELTIDGASVFTVEPSYETQEPHFKQLFDADTVWHRDDIYSSAAMPPLEINDDIRQLSALLVGKTLDFGCGRAGLLREMRERGLDAVGLEVESPLLRQNLADGMEPYVRFYDGSLPLPFGDGEFDSVVAAEVIEHISAYEEIIVEISRVTRDRFIMTVPDMSCIPRCFPHYAVPWHLLERDHRNFFTQRSLGGLLQQHFADVQFFRTCPHAINGTMFYGSVAAVARK